MHILDLAQILTALAYLLATLLFLGGMLARREPVKRIARLTTMGGAALQLIVFLAELASQGLANLPQGALLQLLAFSIVAIFLLLRWRLGSEYLALTAAPLAFLLHISSLTLMSVTPVMPKTLSGPFFGLHIGTLFLSFALLAMAFGAGSLFLMLERKIKAKEKLAPYEKDLPALSTFDRVNHYAVMVGFPLFTLGLASGFIWARFTWGKVLTWDPKEIVSVFIWMAFAVLFHNRLAGGWKGRKPARLAVWIFLFAVISLVGVNFFLPSHHSFAAPKPPLPPLP